MVDIQRAIIRHSVEDVILILENEPVKADMVAEITAVQVMNRVSIAHLSIERALKFLITRANGPLVETHDLAQRYRELLQYDSTSALFLERAFQAAVRHYRYNPNAADTQHLKSLDMYLRLSGSTQAFQGMRYWELTQSLDEILLRRIHLSMHIELLQGLREVLSAPNGAMETAEGRVERAVEDAMWPAIDLAYSSGTPKEHSVRSYIEWIQGFKTRSEALTVAVQKGFAIGDDFMEHVARKAYRSLLESVDPAVRYFASTLDVLPRQPRDVVPCVEWLDPKQERRGLVRTPAGTVLGLIERDLDGLWYITPLRQGLVRVSAKTTSQTNARSYLGTLLTRPARSTVEGEDRNLRIVGSDHHLYERNHNEISRRLGRAGDDKTWTHKITLWDGSHGIEVNNAVRTEVKIAETEGVVAVLEGTVTEVAEHEVYVSGNDTLEMEQKGQE